MRITVLLFFVLLFSSETLTGQTMQQSGWLASFNTIKINKRWSMHAELQVRSTDNISQVQTILPRVGLNYQIKPNQVITGGYACIPNRAAINGASDLLAEHRFWQQYIIVTPFSAIGLTHRFRLEERFVPRPALNGNGLKVNDRLYSTRFRYFARAVISFKKQKPFVRGAFGALQEEVFINISHNDNVNGKWFDQNRLYGAIGYRFSKKFDAEAGYLNQFVERRAGRPNLVNHVVQLAFYTRL